MKPFLFLTGSLLAIIKLCPMERLNEYIDTLTNSLDYLFMPTSDRAWFFFDKGKTEMEGMVMPFRSHFCVNEESTFLGEPFSSSIKQCISIYQYAINKCNVLRSEKVLEEIIKFETSLNARARLYKRIISARLDPLLKKGEAVRDELKVYQRILHNDSSEIEVRRNYDMFMVKWDELYVAITEKKSILEKELDILLGDLNLSIPSSDSVKHQVVVNRPELVFPRKFSLNSAQKLCSLLIKHGFIDSITDFDDLYRVFSLPCESDNSKPIRWIKRTSAVGNNKISRVSLIDLLTLLGYDERCIIGEEGQKYKRLNNCFIIEGRPFKANDFSTDMKHKDTSKLLNVKSEFHDDLLKIIDKIDLSQKK